MNFYEYRGFIIYPTPRLSLDAATWTIDMSIRRGEKVKLFTTDHTFTTKGEAFFHCINFGKRIIDGEIEEYSVDDLL